MPTTDAAWQSGQHTFEIADVGSSKTGFTVEVHPEGRSLYGEPGQQLVFNADRLIGSFDEFSSALQDDPALIRDDDFVSALIDRVITGVELDIALLRQEADTVDGDLDAVADAFDAALDDLKTEIAFWLHEYRYLRDIGSRQVRDDREVFDFEMNHERDFRGITSMYDIIIEVLEDALDEIEDS